MLQQLFKHHFPYGFLIIICCIIIYLYICFIKLMVIDISSWNTLSLVMFLTVYHISLLMLIWSLISTIRTDPGKVPHQWGFNKRGGQQPKYCLICHVYKPQRTHHCATCNRCVLNMDHHCPWVNSCIGFYNRKTFILMLFYTNVISIQNICISMLCIEPIIQKIQYNTSNIIIKLIFICVAFIVNMVIFVTILSFFKFHLGLIFKNYTTIQILDLKRKMVNNQTPQSKYDLGCYYNWMQVFGRSWGTWFIPVFGRDGGPSGDGVLWPRVCSEIQKF